MFKSYLVYVAITNIYVYNTQFISVSLIIARNCTKFKFIQGYIFNFFCCNRSDFMQNAI